MKRMKKQSFMRRISLHMALLILISNLVTYLFAYMFFYQTIYENAKDAGKNMLTANLQIVDLYFRQIDQIADAIIYNESVNNVLKAETDISSNMQVLKSIEQIYYHSRDDLRIIFYKENSPRNAYSIYTKNDYETIANFKASHWYEQLKISGQRKVLLTNIHSEEQINGGDFVHSMIYRIDDLYGNRPVGYLRIDMDLAKLQERLMLNYVGVEGVEILSENGGGIVLYRERTESGKISGDGRDKAGSDPGDISEGYVSLLRGFRRDGVDCGGRHLQGGSVSAGDYHRVFVPHGFVPYIGNLPDSGEPKQ